MNLSDRIASRDVRITVVGLGYVGLPLAVEFAQAGVRVSGYEIDPLKLEFLRQGESYIGDVPSNRVRPLVESGRFTPTRDPGCISHSDVVIICVPTPCVNGHEPDLSFVQCAGRTVSENLRAGQLVILESTSFPGTTEEMLQPILEKSGLKAGQDFHLAFSPERIDPGNPTYGIRNTPKVVAGTLPDATALAEQVYRIVAEEVRCVSSPRVAEMSKLYENTFRHVNIAFANEMALLCEEMGIPIWEVIEAASTKPFGFMPFHPGPGVGGHCIPVDPQYLVYKARQCGCDLKFVELANEINEKMPVRVVEKVKDALHERGKSLDGAKVLVLGVAYKKDIDDVRESPAIKVIARLLKAGARVRYHDPLVGSFDNGVGRFESVDLTPAALRESDCVVICTDHTDVNYDRVIAHGSLVIDTRDTLRRRASDGKRTLLDV